MPRLLLLLIVCGFALSFAPQAFACGGIYPTPIEFAMQYDYFVAAEVVDVDDVGINAVLKVDRYFKGTGGEYLTVMRWPPALQVAGEVRQYHMNCLGSGRHSHFKWKKGSYGYFPLSPNDNGTFRDHWSIATNAHYLPSGGAVTFYSDNEEDRGRNVTLSVEEFEELLLRLSGQEQVAEPQSNSYPLMRFLNIETESGARYRLNPDRSITWIDPNEYPIAISKDGSHVMFRLDDERLGFQYLALMKKPLRYGPNGVEGSTAAQGQAPSDGWLHPKPGLFGAFSPDSDFVAVQEESRLTIYHFASVNIPEAITGNGYEMSVTEIGSYDVDWLSVVEQAPLVWSSDSSTVAYQDSKGVWLLNINDQVEANLILPHDSNRTLLDVSKTGRYLRYGNQETWTLLDVKTGKGMENTLASPDESRLIKISMELDKENAHRTSVIRRYELCTIPLKSCPLVISSAIPLSMLWHDPGYVGLVYSDWIESFPWRYSLEQFCCCCDGRIRGSDLPSISAFAFDESLMQPAFAFDNTRIGLDTRKWDNYDSVDLSEHLDSPIVDLEWGQPIFYEGR